MSTDRVIIPNANVRDLGGYATADGREIKRGVLFRAGHLHNLTTAELTTLTSLGLATIVDLRRPSEVEERPSPSLDGVDNIHLSTSVEDNEFSVISANLHSAEMADRATDQAALYYRNIVVQRLEPYVPVFRVLTADESRPALFHCSAGKDRTGFVAAVLLRLLDVPEETAMADYLLTNEVRREWAAARVEALRRDIASAQGFDIADVTDDMLAPIRAMFAAEPSYIQATFDAVEELYPSWDAFRRDGLGIDDATFTIFREAVLEPTAGGHSPPR